MNGNQKLAQDFTFKKKYGQNFLYDLNMLKFIAKTAEISCADNVLEIGVGAGTLTKVLAESAKLVVGYEIDATLAPAIKQNTQGLNNLNIIYADALKTPIKIIENNFNGQPYKIVANIPYNITSPLLMKFLEESTNVTSVTLMVQKEVAERLVAKPSSSNYGALTVVVAYFGTAKICRIVSKNMFTPRPKVDSAIINIKLFQKTKDNNFAFVVKSAFSNRRKTLVNNLSQSFNLTKNQVEEILEQQNIPKCARGETLTVQDFQKLSQKISEIKRLDKTC